jgi:hypothetical protein
MQLRDLGFTDFGDLLKTLDTGRLQHASRRGGRSRQVAVLMAGFVH